MSPYGDTPMDFRLGPPPAPGDPVGPYRLESVLGAGAMATVFRARDEAGAEVAVKVLNPARVPPEEVKRFTREYRTLSRMDHENVVSVYDTGVHDGYPWIAMEYVDGTDLEGLLARWRKDPPEDRYAQVESLLRGLCHGLQYVHDAGLIHRDVKPQNILVTKGGMPKLSDFGVVTGDGESSTMGFTQLTMAGRLVGTVAFMAPELITAEDVDRRADLYGLGAVLYMLCTFQRPIEADTVAGYLARHLTEIPPPITDIDPTAPPHLARIIQRLLLKDRTWRYPNAQAVLQALDTRDAPDRLPLRGRDPILDRWNHRARHLEDGGGGVVGIVGPRGSGRSHLLEQLLDLARGLGWTVASGRAGPELVPQLGASLDVEPRWGAVDMALAEGPRMIAVDDLDRADPDEIANLARVVRHQVVLEGQPLLLLFTATSTETTLGTLISGESTGIPADQWSLEPLDARPVIALLRDRGVTGRTAPVLARRLHRDYGGQPGGIVGQLEALVETGWFEAAGEAGLRPTRDIDDFRLAELPVPASIQAELEVRMNALDRASAELANLLALIDRPASATLLGRCASLPDRVPGLLDGLERQEVVARDRTDTVDTWTLVHPCAGRVLRARMTGLVKADLHRRIADALSVRRRRANALEVARHLRAGGEDTRAWPLYLQAAKAAARAGKSLTVLQITDEAAALESAVADAVEPGEFLRTRRWLTTLRGEALLARGRWEEAVQTLEHAVELARREDDDRALGRALGSVGRALYRAGRFSDAEPLLVEALDRSGDDASTRAPAARALADIRLRDGRIAESELLWYDALEIAIDQSSRDGEARARRGLAHLRCIQGRLEETGDLLDRADELLDPDGDDRVRAGVLARSVEIETCAGRYGAALRRCESLVELARRRELSSRLPEAYALLAETLVALGDQEGAHDAAHQALVFAKAHGPRMWDARLRAARSLADLDRWDEVEPALPEPEDLPTRPVDDPAAQLAALRGRLYARTHTGKAADQAAWALHRNPPLLAIRAVRIAVDASLALSRVGQVDAARSAVKRGLKALDGPGADGLRLELLLAMQRARPDPRVVKALRQIASRIVEGLSPDQAESFVGREGVEEALFG